MSALVHSAKNCLFFKGTKFQIKLISVVFGSRVEVKFVNNSGCFKQEEVWIYSWKIHLILFSKVSEKLLSDKLSERHIT